jgi:signal transduction histidine kinase
MRGHSEHLEALVEEKTGELLDAERLITAGKVASMVGHDLRGPLQTINNALYIMKNTPEKTVEAQEMTRKAVQRAAGMLEELRNQTREADLNLVPTDLAALIRTIVEETQIPESVNVTLEAGDGLGDVSLDPIQMRRVLDNLIGNAVDAMPKGGKLTVVAMKEDGGFRITVSDTGVGIPEEEMSNLFKLFYTTKSDGMGLGLTFCKRVVEAHGGTITVESEVDEGTTFTIKMPLKLK